MNKRASLVTVTALAAFGVLWACGGGNNDGDDDGVIDYEAGADAKIIYDTGVDAPDPATGQGAQLCDATLGAIKTAIAGCCSTVEKSQIALDLFKNIDTYVTNCETTLEHSISERRLTVNQQDFDACVNAYKAMFAGDGGSACGAIDAFRSFDQISPSCATVFAGKGQPNDPCAGNFDCASGSVCIGYTATTEGKCQAAPPVDGNCGVGATPGVPAVDLLLPPPRQQCASGLFCNAGQCKATTPEDGDCTTTAQCNNDDTCLVGQCVKPTPGPRMAENAGCATSDDCNYGLFCNPTKNLPTDDGGVPKNSTGLCAKSVADGEVCAPGNAHQCQSNNCASNLQCDKFCSYP